MYIQRLLLQLQNRSDIALESLIKRSPTMSQSQSQSQMLYVTVLDRTHTFDFGAISQRHRSSVAIARCKRTLSGLCKRTLGVRKYCRNTPRYPRKCQSSSRNVPLTFSQYPADVLAMSC